MAISDVSPPLSLVDVFLFDDMMQNIGKDSPDLKFLVCARVDAHQQSAFPFLMACHRIMSGSFGFEEAFLALQPEQRDGQIGSTAFKNSLRAISCARCLNWIDFSAQSKDDDLKKDFIEMHEHMHYSRFVE